MCYLLVSTIPKQETPDPWNQNLLLLCTMWEENFRPGKCLIYFLWGNRLNYVSISIRYKYKCEVSQYRIDFSLTMNLHSSVFLMTAAPFDVWSGSQVRPGQVDVLQLVRFPAPLVGELGNLTKLHPKTTVHLQESPLMGERLASIQWHLERLIITRVLPRLPRLEIASQSPPHF